MNLTLDRYEGALLGLAVGDALGTTVEFKPRGSFTPLTGIVGGGPFQLRAGQWTDDTSMALCLGESLLATGDIDLRDQASRYVQWWMEGHNSCTGTCFDIGNTVRSALNQFLQTGEPASGASHPMSAGNGSIMRLAPVPLFFADDPARVIEASAQSSRTTHQAEECLDACRFFGALIAGAAGGISKDDLLDAGFFEAFSGQSLRTLSPKVAEIAAGGYRTRDPDSVRGSGYVVDSLNAALWAFWSSDDFATGALMAVNLGDDADTTGAVYGQLAGACHGKCGIPESWRKMLAWRERIETMGGELFQATALNAPSNHEPDPIA